MLASPLRLFAVAALIGMACCVPLVNAECATSHCPTTPVYHPAPVIAVVEPPLFVSPFQPLDVFVFVGVPVAVVQQPAGQVQAQPPAGGQPDPVPAGFPVARGYAGKAAAVAAAPATDLKEVAAVLTSCMACHTAPAGKKGVNIFAANGAFDPKVSPAAIYRSVEKDDMPLRGVKLTPSQKTTIAAWVAATQKGT